MTEVAFHTVLSPPKRPHSPYIESSAVFDSTLPTIPYSMTRPSSPTPSSLSSLTELSTIDSATNLQSGPPTKKRKLNFIEKEAEKAAKQREKDEKQRAKAEDKARKEDEKSKKDEERRKAAEERENAKRLKDIERAEKQKAKEDREAKKEAEKASKEAEKLKKERSQMRLGAFFVKPAGAGTSPLPSSPDVSEGVSSRRSSIASIDIDVPLVQPPRPTTISANPEYENWILPFFVPEYTTLAPHNRFKHGKCMTGDMPVFNKQAEPIRKHLGYRRRHVRRLPPVKEVMKQVQELGSMDSVDLVLQDTLETYSFKIIHFHEDVRPPYQGTVTREISQKQSRTLATHPNSRALPNTNYDYDSEAEWEPPGEDDEELNDDDEMSDADENEEEMDDFLDDADDIGRKKGPLIDMEPVSTGLCWECTGDDDLGMNQYRMDVLHDSVQLPINPFSAQHWSDTEKTLLTAKLESNSTTMQPPRHPLATLTANAVPLTKKDVGIDGKPVPPKTQKPVPPSSNKPVKLVDAEFMPAFKAAVSGSDLTKAGIIEILKKQFPKCSKDAIKDTLGAVAKRVGKKEVEKKWVLIEDQD